MTVPPDEVTETLAERYLGDAKSAVYLIRPDQHVVGRWTSYDAEDVAAAMRKSIGKDAT